MVGFGVWVMVGLWLKWVVGHGSAKLHTASLSSLIVDRRAGFGSVGWDRLMVGLKRWICWSVGGLIGLIIDSSDGGFGDDFFWMGLLRWVSNQLGFKLAAWVDGFLVPWLWLLMGWGADGFLVPWLWLLMGWSVLMGFWCRGYGCWWVDRQRGFLIDGLSWLVARVFGAVAVVVDGLYVARGWGRRRGKKKKKDCWKAQEI